MTSSKMMNRAPQPLPCHAYQQPQPRPLSVAGGGASQYHQAHRQRPLSSVIGVKQQQQLLQQRPLSSVIGVKQQQQQLLQQQHKPQRPLSTMFDGCVDYGWVDSDGYVQRTGASATLPRNHGGQALKPQRSAEQVPLTYHQHHHHSQHVASMSSRPSSYQSAEEPHYEVIEDSYYYNRGGGRQGQQQQQQRAGYVRKERYVSSTDMDVTPLSPPPPPPPPATHADRRGTFTKAEVHRAPVPVTLTSDLDEGHSFSRSSLSKSEQDLLQAQVTTLYVHSIIFILVYIDDYNPFVHVLYTCPLCNLHVSVLLSCNTLYLSNRIKVKDDKTIRFISKSSIYLLSVFLIINS